MIIETKNATHIAINIPVADSATMLPSLVSLFENNAIFINNGWSEIKTVTPEIVIKLTDKFVSERHDIELLITTEHPAAVSVDFARLSADAFISCKKQIEGAKKELDRVRNELAISKQLVSELNDKIESLTNETQT